MEERGWLLERERESAAQHAVDAERARIARELHDIVSHNVSMMLIQAGAARQVLAAARPRRLRTGRTGVAEDALLAVESAGRGDHDRAAASARRAGPGAGRPRRTDGDPGLAPQPTLTRLSALVDKIAFAGLPVDVRISGEPRPLPGGIDATAYRIVQEALTNALKHGGCERRADRPLRRPLPADRGADSGQAGSLDGIGGDRHPGEKLGTGRGLMGLKERVAVYGGDLDARRRLGGGFRVRAKIPLDPPAMETLRAARNNK